MDLQNELDGYITSKFIKQVDNFMLLCGGNIIQVSTIFYPSWREIFWSYQCLLSDTSIAAKDILSCVAVILSDKLIEVFDKINGLTS
jgi:hypothetical protein